MTLGACHFESMWLWEHVTMGASDFGSIWLPEYVSLRACAFRSVWLWEHVTSEACDFSNMWLWEHMTLGAYDFGSMWLFHIWVLLVCVWNQHDTTKLTQLCTNFVLVSLELFFWHSQINYTIMRKKVNQISCLQDFPVIEIR